MIGTPMEELMVEVQRIKRRLEDVEEMCEYNGKSLRIIGVGCITLSVCALIVCVALLGVL